MSSQGASNAEVLQRDAWKKDGPRYRYLDWPKECSSSWFGQRAASKVHVNGRNFRYESASVSQHAGDPMGIDVIAGKPLYIVWSFQVCSIIFVSEVMFSMFVFSVFLYVHKVYILFRVYCSLLNTSKPFRVTLGGHTRGFPLRYSHFLGFLYGYRIGSDRTNNTNNTNKNELLKMSVLHSVYSCPP